VERQKPSSDGLVTAYAKQQYINAAEARRRLWAILRRKQIKGEPFTRQEPIGPYLVDFYCAGAKLAILLDDRLPDGGALDAEVRWLEQQGHTALRLGAEDVRRYPEQAAKLLGTRFKMRGQPRAKTKPEGYSGPSNLS
jgi:very-short-patch-repair endonuclease